MKLINSLQKKKYRDQHQLFVAEGNKLVSDLLHANLTVSFVVCTAEWKHTNTVAKLAKAEQLIEIEAVQFKKISSLKTPSSVLGVFRMPKTGTDERRVKESLSLVLDDVQDPGNLGTIVRIADWFGIEHVFCSPTTVDLYNPKVVQATMGALSRVKVVYTALPDLIRKYQCKNFPIYGTFLEGDSIYKSQLQNKGFIIMGNEGKGISNEIKSLISDKLFIPNFPVNQETSESLNVSVATAIVCSEFRRPEF